jgi:hypothetical protein
MADSATTSHGRGERARSRPSAAKRLLWSPVAILLVLLMAAGSILMWVGLPLGLIWLASSLTNSSQPSLGPYLLILIGLPVGMVIIGKALGTLDKLHGRMTGRLDVEHQRAPWLQSMRDERGPRRKQRSVLDTVMIISVLLAIVAGAVWFFAFAGSSLPS